MMLENKYNVHGVILKDKKAVICIEKLFTFEPEDVLFYYEEYSSRKCKVTALTIYEQWIYMIFIQGNSMCIKTKCINIKYGF